MDSEPYAKLWEIIEPGSHYAGRSDSQFARSASERRWKPAQSAGLMAGPFPYLFLRPLSMFFNLGSLSSLYLGFMPSSIVVPPAGSEKNWVEKQWSLWGLPHVRVGLLEQA